MRKAIATLDIVEGPLYRGISEDGEIISFDCSLVAETTDGKVYAHKHLFKGMEFVEEFGAEVAVNSKVGADELFWKVIERGCIDTKHWIYQGTAKEIEAATPSLEERWHEEWVREDMERKGHIPHT